MVIAAPALNFQPQQATLPVKSFLQRLLLVTDGRITDIVRVYSGETIKAIKIQQQLTISSSRFSPLKLDGQSQLLNRSIALQGSQTKTNYLYADSQIVLDRLDKDLHHELLFSHEPICKLLQKHRVETYREILDCGIEPAGCLGQYFEIEADAELIYRTYLVLVDGLPIMQITEKFPTTHFVD